MSGLGRAFTIRCHRSNAAAACIVVALVLVALVVSLAGGQSVEHLMNCHRSGEDLGRWTSYLILWTQPRALPLLQMIRNHNDRIEDRCNGSDQGQL